MRLIQKVGIYCIYTSMLVHCFSCQMPKPSKNFESFLLSEMTITDLETSYRKGSFTVRKIVELYLDRIEKIDKNGPELNSIIIVNPEALKIADSLDQILKLGNQKGVLFGVPVLLKDNINTNDKMPTTAGSRVLANSFPTSDSWVAKKLRESGAVIIGKTNLSEWANYRASFSSSGWSGIGGQTKNPYVLDRNPCGSSSGSGVAVSANLCIVAVGTETWGSIICPSNANGIVGIKPTVGLWSRSGIVPISYTQDTAGPMARTVKDAAILLGAVTGIDTSDKKTTFSSDHFSRDYTQYLNKNGLNSKRIGYLKLEEGKHHKVDSLMHDAVRYLKSKGVEIIELERLVDGTPYNNSITILAYEFKDGLKKYFDNLGEKSPITNLDDAINATLSDSLEMAYFNIERMKNSQSKGSLDTEEYIESLENMLKAYRDDGIDSVMDKYKLDAIISLSGSPAWKTDLINGDNFSISSSVYAALSGYPNINVPMGFVGEVPVGISFFGRAWSEPVLLEIAYAYEQGTKKRKPPRFLLSD